MLTLLWILAFVGVALIYLVPYVGKKVGFSQNLNAGIKLAGVILAAVCLVALYRIGGFN